MRDNNCSYMGVGQPDIQTTWNSLYASTYWNMRLSVASAAKDAQVQNDILLSEFTRNLVVLGRQPNPDPIFASYVSSGCPHRLQPLRLQPWQRCSMSMFESARFVEEATDEFMVH